MLPNLNNMPTGVKIILLKNMTETMSDLKNSGTERGEELYKQWKNDCQILIEHLQKKGVKKETHPEFETALINYKYWK